MGLTNKSQTFQIVRNVVAQYIYVTKYTNKTHNVHHKQLYNKLKNK